MWTVPTRSIRRISPPCARKLRCTRGKSQHAEWTCRRARPAGRGTVAAPAVRQHTVGKLAARNLLPSTHSIEQRARELKSYRRQPPVFWKGSGTVPTRTDVIWRNCVHFRAPRERLNGTSPSAETGVWGKFRPHYIPQFIGIGRCCSCSSSGPLLACSSCSQHLYCAPRRWSDLLHSWKWSTTSRACTRFVIFSSHPNESSSCRPPGLATSASLSTTRTP